MPEPIVSEELFRTLMVVPLRPASTIEIVPEPEIVAGPDPKARPGRSQGVVERDRDSALEREFNTDGEFGTASTETARLVVKLRTEAATVSLAGPAPARMVQSSAAVGTCAGLQFVAWWKGWPSLPVQVRVSAQASDGENVVSTRSAANARTRLGRKEGL